MTAADVQALVDSRSATKASSTLLRQHACLRAILASAESDDLIARSPCRGIGLPRVHLVDRPYLDADQLTRLAGALGPDQGAMVWLGAVLGLRWAEVAGLTVDRLDLLGGSLTVDRKLARSGDLVVPKSTAGIRTLACPTWLVDELAAVLKRRGLTAADGHASAAGSPDDQLARRTTAWPSRTSLAMLRFSERFSPTPTTSSAPTADATFSSVSSVGLVPPPSIRAMADCVVPIRAASSAWVSPASVRRR
ncbi:MAG TPA: hypothetical protein VKV36_09990 [Acidimicrobiales bacterium]|nr:hypothetical protein [Acidimicrobiales bacterium]